MASKKYVVRVVIPASDSPHVPPLAGAVDGGFLECLRYAGVVRVHYDNEKGQCFDLIAPAGTDSKMWSEQNAARMITFGYNAVSSPQWD